MKLHLLLNGAPVTFLLMIIIGTVSLLSFMKTGIFQRLLLHPFSVYHHRQYYRLFTADLVHVDFVHFVLNEFMLYLSCANLEETLRKSSSLGSIQFLVIYLCSYFTGVIVTTIRHRNDFKFSSAGASGSIVGCMISFMMLKPDFIAFYLPIIGGIRNKFDALLYILILIFMQRKKPNSLSNHELHFFGALGGILGTLLLFPRVII